MAVVGGGRDEREEDGENELGGPRSEAPTTIATASETAPDTATATHNPSTSLASHRKSGPPASLQRSRSYGDGHGFVVHAPDEYDNSDAEKAGAAAEDGTMNGGGKGDAEDRGRGEKGKHEVQWDGEGDARNPRNFGKARKWMIVLVVSAGSTCVTCASSMYTLTYEQITQEFGVSRVVATLGLSLFVMGLGIGPMVLGPLSEFYGRRPIYVVSFAVFLIWLVCLIFRIPFGTNVAWVWFFWE